MKTKIKIRVVNLTFDLTRIIDNKKTTTINM